MIGMKPWATRAAVLCACCALTLSGCKKTDDTNSNYKNALNSYFEAHPVCLWSQPKRFPTQANTSDSGKTSPLDALVDQNLLVRTTGEKKELLIISKQVNNYDLSDHGRSAWTADVNQPGYGNFCYGHWTVAAIDSATPTTSQPGATTQVSYHLNLEGTPAWATAPETQTAYPAIRLNLAPSLMGSATLTNTQHGWTVTSANGAAQPASNGDDGIVQ